VRPSVQEECDRVIPVVEGIRARCDVVVSVDTSRAVVIEEAAKAGAQLINDVRGLREPGVIQVCAQYRLAVAIMHMQGEPDTMQLNPRYADVVAEVRDYLTARTNECLQSGIPAQSILWDPGFGFGKTAEHNRQLFNDLGVFTQSPYPVLVGLSRKSWVGHLTGRTEPRERLAGSITLAALAALKGALVIRAHDVKETRDALQVVARLACSETSIKL
jgi:dihydropteroate synthase